MAEAFFANRRWLLPALKVVVSATLLTLLFRQADLPALTARLRQVEVGWMLAALAIYAGMVWLSAWRWRLLLAAQSVRVRSRTLSESFLVATFFNNFLPSNIGGDVVRIADTAPFTGSKTLATTVVLADRGLGLVALFLLASCGSAIAAAQGTPVPGGPYLWLVLVIAVAAGAPLLASPQTLPRLLRPLRVVKAGWVEVRLARLGDAMERFRRAPAMLAAAFGGAILVQLLLVAFYLCAARGLDVPLAPVLGVVIVPITLAVQMLPISINGFGVREAAFAFYFTEIGLTVESALALSLVSAGLIMLFSITGGVLFLVRRGSDVAAGTVRYETQGSD